MQVLLALLLGWAIGLSLGLVGGGGSILAVPILVYALGEEVHAATTASLLVVGTTALVGGLDHARAGRVHWRLALVFGAVGSVGAIVGTALNRVADPDLILFLFALLLLGAAFATARGREGTGHVPAPAGASLAFKAAPLGLAVGLLTGFFGVGGGFLIVPVFAVLLSLPIGAAIGTSLIVIALTSATALAAHLSSGSIDWGLAAALTASAIVGALSGSRLAGRLSQRRLRRAFAAVVAAVAVLLLAETLTTFL